MKKIAFLIMTLIISSCVKLPDPAESITVKISSKNLNSNSGNNALLITSNYTNPNNFKLSSYGICWSIDNTEPTIKSNVNSINLSVSNIYAIQISDLQMDKTYKLRPFVKTSTGGVVYGLSEEITTPSVSSINVSNIKANSAIVSGDVSKAGSYTILERGIVYATTSNPKTTDTKKNLGIGTGIFALELTNLSHNTTYYARAYILTSESAFYGPEINFKTLLISAPTLKNSSATFVTSSSAIISGEVESDGNSTIIERGVVYATTTNPTTSNTKILSVQGLGIFSVNLNSLISNTTYYARTFARNSLYTGYGPQATFKTEPLMATVGIYNISSSSISSSTVYLTGNIISTGNELISEKGFVIAEHTEPTTADRKIASGSGSLSFYNTIDNLKPYSLYYTRAYAISIAGTAYSSEKVFRTLGTTPTVSTTIANNVTSNSVVIGGYISGSNGSDVSERGIYYSSSNTDPFNYGTKVMIGSGEGLFSKEIINLTPNTKYYYIAYATNSYGKSKGSVQSFTTTSSLASLTTGVPSSVTTNGASISVGITSTGGENITERGIVYGKSTSPTTSNSKVQSSSTSNSFTVVLTNLDFATKYYARGYAINTIGIAYGNEVNLTTLATLPTVTTSPATVITTRDASVTCEVKEDGGGTITERGVVFSTYQNPTTSSNKITSGSGKGIYTTKISPLSSNTTYYARAYATNSAGTAYGQQIAFTTEQVKIPVLTTGNASGITAHTANITGTITNDGGGSISRRGIQYSTSSTFASNIYTVDATLDADSDFSKIISNLSHNTKYYAKTFAINSAGTGFGNVITFQTENATIATISTLSASNIGTVTATCSGSITSNGNSPITEVGIIFYSNSTYLTNYGTRVKATLSQSGNYSVNLNGLHSNYSYYFAAYAVNNVGTKYGTTLSFVTSAPSFATVTTLAVSVINSNSALVGGNVTNEGNSSVTSRGIVYSTTANPTYNNNKVIISSGAGSFSQTFTNFVPNTTYYIRAFAYNAAGYAYGNQVIFSTPVATPAAVSTSDAKNITHNSVTLGGNLTSEGNSSVSDKGIVYSMIQNPSLSNGVKISKGTGTGIFEGQVTNLNSNAIYYARAYATNSYGTVYGNQVSFTTDIAPPTFSNTTLGRYSGYVILYSTVSSDNSASITERGFVYSKTNSNPTTSDTKVTAGSGAGSYNATINNLTGYVNHYFKAYVITSKGTYYSSVSSFYSY